MQIGVFWSFFSKELRRLESRDDLVDLRIQMVKFLLKYFPIFMFEQRSETLPHFRDSLQWLLAETALLNLLISHLLVALFAEEKMATIESDDGP